MIQTGRVEVICFQSLDTGDGQYERVEIPLSIQAPPPEAAQVRSLELVIAKRTTPPYPPHALRATHAAQAAMRAFSSLPGTLLTEERALYRQAQR